MKDVTKIINLIKAQPLTTRLFRQLCEEANSEYSTLLLYCETRWLPRSNALERLWILRSEVKNLLTNKKHCLAMHFQDTKWLSLAHLVDIFGHLNEINTNLQGPKHNTISINQEMCACKSKLGLWRMRAVERKIASFSRLAKYLEDTELSFESVKDGVLQHLGKLNKRPGNCGMSCDSAHFMSLNPGSDIRCALSQLMPQFEGIINSNKCHFSH